METTPMTELARAETVQRLADARAIVIVKLSKALNDEMHPDVRDEIEKVIRESQGWLDEYILQVKVAKKVAARADRERQL